MTRHTVIAQRGARRVGILADLSPVEQLAVSCLRIWSLDPASQTRLLAILAHGLGAVRARAALEVMNEMMHIASRYGRRPFIRHAPDCDCLGADEAVFAGLIEAALDDDPDEAGLFAALVVRPDVARPFAGLAMELAVALSSLLRDAPQMMRRQTHPEPQTAMH
ncbi:hypothetical protein [Shimia sp. FJ5]|uniref:hypothetical protein n=1 Tax=Shimia sp. FJ5 TaxID=3079054 RepID=UPI002638FFAD|nr:hypothetical protein [Shimia sp. FJ5]MDV4144955.1 hypothetical protein [Shimia sp. FJ5]